MKPFRSKVAQDIADQVQKNPGNPAKWLPGILAYAQGTDLRTDVIEDYDDLADGSRDDPLDHEVHAALALYIFVQSAEIWGRNQNPGGLHLGETAPVVAPNADPRRVANRMLNDEAARNLLFTLYEVPDTYHDRSATLHAVGTTSFILHLESKGDEGESTPGQSEHSESDPNQDKALKIVKPWYLDDRDIARETKCYQEKYGALADLLPGSTPRVDSSGSAYIVMEYIHGPTLRQHVHAISASLGKGRASRAVYITSLRDIMAELCALLEQYATLEPPVYHGDLSTTNIMVNEADGKLRLIDFGVNYLLSHRVGTIEEYLNYRGHTPPGSFESLEADLYALGFLLTECLLIDQYERKDLQTLLDMVHQAYPEAGLLLDDLLDPRPGYRLVGVDRDEGLYALLIARMKDSLNAAAASLQRSNLVRLLDAVLQFGPPSPVVSTFDLLRRSAASSDPRARLAVLLMLLPIALNGITVVVFIYNVIGMHDPTFAAAWGTPKMLLLPVIGWMVALSSSIVAVRHFEVLWADIPWQNLPGAVWWTTPLCAVGIWGAVLYALIVDNRAWPLCVAAGIFIVCLNNFAWSRTLPELLGMVEQSKLSVSTLMEEKGRKTFRSWAGLSAIYTGSVACVGVLAGVPLSAVHLSAYDAGFLGLAVTFGANGRMYVSQLIVDAPALHAGLVRCLASYRRCSTKSVKGPPAAQGSLPVSGIPRLG